MSQMTGVSTLPGLRDTPTLQAPPLESGDRLTRREFERRYKALPNIKKAELIEGVVYMPSPVRMQSHGLPHSLIVSWLGHYYAATPRLHLGDNATLRLDVDNEPQPDAMLFIDPAVGGRAHIDAEDYVEGTPELILEVAASSAAIDLHQKKTAYRRAGVQEYIVWQVYDQRIDWWELRDDEYSPLAADNSYFIRSRVFPGLWLNVNAMLAHDLAQVLTTLQAGVASPEHAAFVARLQPIQSD